MSSENVRVAVWLDFVADLLQEPLTEFPHARIREQLSGAFDVVAISWNWRHADGEAGLEMGPSSVVAPEVSTTWPTQDVLARHPLVQWFAASFDPRPFTNGRVPAGLVPREDRCYVEETLRPLCCEQQLSIPHRLNGLEHGAFVLARTGTDFDDDDLAVARRLQPLLVALDRQSRILGSFAGPLASREVTQCLTGRETAVLALLVQGRTAAAIAARLMMSPRTANKHIEHIYRKLGVTDRLAAAQLTARLGLLEASALSVPRDSAVRGGQRVTSLNRTVRSATASRRTNG